jgi:hypothetical protein
MIDIASGTLVLPDLQHWTRNVPDHRGHPGHRITEHYEAILKYNAEKNNSKKGAYFEAVVYDALVFEGVDPDRIGLSVDVSNLRDADADFLIAPPGKTFAWASGNNWIDCTAILCKTSLRERWKQVDRDAGIIHGITRGDVFGLVHKEQTDSSLEKMQRLLQRHEKKLSARDTSFITTLDDDAVSAMIRGLL